MKDFIYYFNEEVIAVIILGILAIGIGILVNHKIEDCHEKGGTYIRGYCVSTEVIK